MYIIQEQCTVRVHAVHMTAKYIKYCTCITSALYLLLHRVSWRQHESHSSYHQITFYLIIIIIIIIIIITRVPPYYVLLIIITVKKIIVEGGGGRGGTHLFSRHDRQGRYQTASLWLQDPFSKSETSTNNYKINKLLLKDTLKMQ